jgi:hypothetical protein
MVYREAAPHSRKKWKCLADKHDLTALPLHAFAAPQT